MVEVFESWSVNFNTFRIVAIDFDWHIADYIMPLEQVDRVFFLHFIQPTKTTPRVILTQQVESMSLGTLKIIYYAV